MRIMPLEKRGISNSRIVFGCMGIGGEWNSTPYTKEDYIIAEKAVEAALSIGITMFDHADIYKRGKSESIFGEILKKRPDLRDQIILQSKCGIRFQDDVNPQRFDFSKGHILSSVDGILQRLGVEHLDVLLLHRPDPLMEPEEIAEAFNQLRSAGKVRHFGVSNMTSAQMRFIQNSLPEPLVVNQLEMSLARLDWVEQGILVNQKAGVGINFADGILEHCQMADIQIQAWGPLAQGKFSGRVVEDAPDTIKNTAALVQKMANEKESTPESIVLGWLMKHPARIQPVIGTSSAERVLACQDAVRISETMTREEWYTLLESSRGARMP
ncbi:putative oxidoreductase [Paenibacillus sp. V4I3]|uniref:aldo/keto reductase n=1 Tax=unclassified Paenibacillus TaxID=185978 RepID=UPI002780094F|nr:MULTISPECIES: aldo/keto reductase [unclassified Paenibacillus]MDQ0871732.1 putative oxidoreductase [Paenibacillus sp. V4I3]MDQ0892383.1 putative oxidoreductase [Paenibacillus sp. V4I9]